MRAEPDTLLFQERVQRFIQARGWWTFAQVTGLFVGGLVILYSGLIPWYEVGGRWGAGEYDGLSLLRGRLAFSLGAVLMVVATLRIYRPNDRVRLGSAVLAGGCAVAVIRAEP